MIPSKLFKAPIPGENLTVNSKGYAWHKPPQYPKYDDAFELFIDEVFGDGERMSNVANLTSFGLSTLAITQTMLVNAVGSGKISPDMSLLLAGPVYKTMNNALDRLGVRYLSGYETPQELKEFAEYISSKGEGVMPAPKKPELTPQQESEMEAISEEVTADIPTGGLMGAQSDEELVEIPSESTGTGLVLEQNTEEGEA